VSTIRDVIVYRYYIKGVLEFESPLTLGSGEKERSDHDVLRNWDGDLLIPGTSIAGATRHYLKSLFTKDDSKVQDLIDEIYGQDIETKKASPHENASVISMLSTYDAVCGDHPVSIRDGIKIDPKTKLTEDKAKYDYEIVEPGAKFPFRLDLIIRQNREAQVSEIENIMFLLLKGFQDREIPLGAKTRRGFGFSQLKDLKILKLALDPADKSMVGQWIGFQWDNLSPNCKLDDLPSDIFIPHPQNCELLVDFDIPSSILIRSPNTDPSGADVTHLSSLKGSIIPGTSWNGALRHAIYQIGTTLDKKIKFDSMVKSLFGYVEIASSKQSGATGEAGNNMKEKAKASRIWIGESVILKSQKLNYTRNRINKFAGGVINSALFTEQPSYSGSVSLKIKIQDFKPYEIGLVLLGIKELWYGIQSIGGGSNVGRGVLTGKTVSIQKYDEKAERDYYEKEEFEMEQLGTYLMPLAQELHK